MDWQTFVVALWTPLMAVLGAAVWPVAVLIAAWWSRPLLSRLGEALGQLLANRDFKFKVGSMEASMGVAAAQQNLPASPPGHPDQDDGDTALPGHQLPTIAPSARVVVNEFEAELRSQLEQLNASDQLATLSRWYAELRATATHEFLFNRIWTSQIALLNVLNQSGGSLPSDDVKSRYAMVTEAFPDGYPAPTMEVWVHFLLAYRLAVWEGTDLHITEFGKDFLLYLVTAGLNPVTKGY